ncbi:MAG TPA: hypothetical protein PKD86_03990 [Gemmatales bacterium]|nr:hypothetical protein [Gemmatales bacterium]HMP58494.1 hypothetical protein [Gemmatales bacterium]
MSLTRSLGLAFGALAMASSTGCWHSQYEEKTATPTAMGTPVLVVPTEIKLGERERGDQVTGQVELRNEGTAPLEVGPFYKTCSCGAVEEEANGVFAPVERVTVPPGGSRRLRMKLAVDGHAGQAMRQRLSFATNDPKQPQAAVDFLVERILGTVAVSPERVLFGRVLVGTPLTQTIDVYDPMEFPRSLDKLDVTHSAIQVRRDETPPPEEASKAGRWVMRLVVTVDTSRPQAVSGTIRISVPGQGKFPLEIPVAGDVVAAVTSLPRDVILPRRTSAGMLYQLTVRLSTFAGMIESLEVTSAPPGVKVELPTAISPEAVVAITLDPAAFPTQAPEPERTIRMAVRVDGVVHEVLIPVLHVP